MAELYYEDLLSKDEVPMGTYPVTQEQILAFARDFDPQWIHTDPGKAAQGPFGGLIASGFHTLSIMMRLACHNHIVKSAAIGSPGMDEVRYLAPVRPGQSVKGTRKVLDNSVSRSKPDRGQILMLWSLYDERGVLLATAKVWGIYRRRQVDATSVSC